MEMKSNQASSMSDVGVSYCDGLQGTSSIWPTWMNSVFDCGFSFSLGVCFSLCPAVGLGKGCYMLAGASPPEIHNNL